VEEIRGVAALGTGRRWTVTIGARIERAGDEMARVLEERFQNVGA
jgi:hypothetical protein